MDNLNVDNGNFHENLRVDSFFSRLDDLLGQVEQQISLSQQQLLSEKLKEEYSLIFTEARDRFSKLNSYGLEIEAKIEDFKLKNPSLNESNKGKFKKRISMIKRELEIENDKWKAFKE